MTCPLKFNFISCCTRVAAAASSCFSDVYRLQLTAFVGEFWYDSSISAQLVFIPMRGMSGLYCDMDTSLERSVICCTRFEGMREEHVSCLDPCRFGFNYCRAMLKSATSS